MHTSVVVILVLVALGLLGECSQSQDTYNVLALLPLVSPRNHQFDEAVLMALARRGHRVTVYSEFPPDSPHPRYNHVRLNEDPHPAYEYFDQRWATWKKSDSVTLEALNGDRFYKTGAYVKNSVQFRSLQDNIKSGKEHYDVIITEPLDGQEHLLLFAHWANAPLVVLEPVSRNINTDVLSEVQASPSLFGLTSLVSKLFSELNPFDDPELLHLYYLDDANIWLKSNYGDPPPMWKLLKSTPILTYTNDMMAKNVTYPTVRVSGIHINSSPPPLPEDVQLFMDQSERDVVVINIEKSEPELDDSQAQPYYLALRNLVQNLPDRVVWSSSTIREYAGPTVSALPTITQQVLEHINCKLLITDGDLLRVQEAIYYGVPVLVVPQTPFQNYTAAYIKSTGMGEVIDPEEFKTPLRLRAKVHAMLLSVPYKERAQNISREFRSEMSDREEAVHLFLVKAVSTPKPTTEDFYKLTYISPQDYLFDNYVYIYFFILVSIIVIINIKIIVNKIIREERWVYMEHANGRPHMMQE